MNFKVQRICGNIGKISSSVSFHQNFQVFQTKFNIRFRRLAFLEINCFEKIFKRALQKFAIQCNNLGTRFLSTCYSNLLYLLVYYNNISLVRALWLVNLAGRTLLYGPLKFKVDSVAKLFCDLSPTVLNFHSKEEFIFFTLNYVLQRANDLKTISNWIVLLSRCVRNLKPFHVNKNRSWAPQTHSRDIINILLTSFSRSVL